MKRFSIRYRKDGNGHWFEIRDEQRRLVAQAWNHGRLSVAQKDARDAIHQLNTNAARVAA